MARVLILRSNPLAPDPRVDKIARTLAKAGYIVHALGWDRTAQLPACDQQGGVQIHRLLIKAPFGKGLGNLPQLLRWQAALMSWLGKRHTEYDILHACDFDTIIPALACKWMWGLPVVYDIFDFYADHLRSTPALIKNIIRWIDLHAINAADALILVDDARRVQVAGSHPKRSTVVYNSPEDAVVPLPSQDSSSTKGNLRIAYIGLLQVERGLLELIEVVSRHPQWSLDLAGFGGDEERILARAALVQNITWHGRIPYDKTIKLSQQADVLIATYDPIIPNHRYSSPNKIFEAMMLAKPVIVADNSNMDRIIRAIEGGMVVPYGDIKALESAFLQLSEDPDLRAKLGKNARRAYDETYSWQCMESRLLSLYRSLPVQAVDTTS